MKCKCIGLTGLLIAFAGSIFAAYDNFSTFNTLNTDYVPACKQWNIIVSKIEPYTTNSRVPIEKMSPFYTFERKNKEFDILLSIIKSNSKAVNLNDLNADKLILGASQINSGTRLGGSVILATGSQQWFITTPDILLQWVRDFRKTWFLKWGLILIAVGTLLRIIKEIFL